MATNWDLPLDILRKVAPGLATALGGPLAGAAVQVIANALGKPGAPEDEVLQTLATQGLTGEQIVALKAAEQSFALEMEKVDAAREAAGLADVQSARSQTVELAKAGSGIAWAPPLISVVILIGFFGCIFMLFFSERSYDERTANLLNVLFGALIPGFVQVCQYWLGSSNGSKRSGDAVRAIAEKATAENARRAL